MKPIVIEFNYDPDMPLESRHKGIKERCLVYGSKEFKSFSKARAFLLECSSPITTLEELDRMEWEAEFRYVKNKVHTLERQLRYLNSVDMW